mgnify:CR=1 FL=1
MTNPLQAEKIAVVGANGFIGSHLVNLLSSESRNFYSFTRESPFDCEDLDFFKDFSCVVWCATSINPYISNVDSKSNLNEIDNWKNFLKQYQRLSSNGFNPRIILLSSGGCVYPDTTPPFKEDLDGIPVNIYGQVKKEMESLAQQSISNLAILRLSNVYGPGQPTGVGQGVIAEWIYKVLQGIPIEIYGKLDSFRDFIFVDDVVQAILLSINSNDRLILNIGSGGGTRLEILLNTISELTGVVPVTNSMPSRKVDRIGYWLDISDARKILGWTPKISLIEGTRRLIDFEKNKAPKDQIVSDSSS